MILNHFRHNKRISLHFYVLSSLEHNLENHTKNSDNPILYQGLIILIMEYAKDHGVKPSPFVITSNYLTKPDVQIMLDMKMEEEGSGMAMDLRDP